MVKLRNLHWTLLIAVFIASMMVVLPTSASSTTISVEPPTIVSAGETFSVDVTITDVVDLTGYEFKLGYDTAVLTATEITIGDFFTTYITWADDIYEDEGYVHCAISVKWGEPGVNGSGVLATITFSVDDYGDSVLDLYKTKLTNSEGYPIYPDVIDGYCYVSGASLWAKVVTVKKRYMDICTIQTIKGLITNKGEEGTYVRAQFVIVDATTHTPVDVATSDELWIDPVASVMVTAEWHAGEPGSYYVKGVIEFSADGINWLNYGMYVEILGGLESFRVVGPSWFKVA